MIDDPSVTDLVFPFVFLRKTSNGKKKKIADEEVEERMDEERRKRTGVI